MTSEITFADVLFRALQYIQRKDAPAPTDNSEFFASMRAAQGHAAVQRFQDNLYLEWACWYIRDIEVGAITVEAIAKVRACALVAFALYPGQPLTFDLEAAASGLGSPWEAQCEDADEWTIHFARLLLQDGDGCIEAWDDLRILLAAQLLRDLRAAGLSDAAIEAHFLDLCSGNVEFADALSVHMASQPLAA